MAAATAPVGTHLTPHEGSMRTKRLLSSTAGTFYPGAMLSINSSGYAIKAADTASTLFLGIVAEPKPLVVPSGGSNGDYTIEVARPRYFRAIHSGLTVADIGKLAYIVDDTTVALAATTSNDIAAGRINDIISSTEVEVEILPMGQNA